MSRVDGDADMTLMNYGWADADVHYTLQPSDEVNRYCLQLYGEVAGAVDLIGRDVLEIGSGRGGGASYMSRYLEARSVTGLDFSPKSIEFAGNTTIYQGWSSDREMQRNWILPNNPSMLS